MSDQNRTLYLKYADSLRHSNDFSKAISEFFAPEASGAKNSEIALEKSLE